MYNPKKTYIAYFTGKTKDAIGRSQNYSTTVRGIDEEEARINLYERYDHIIQLKLKLINEDTEYDYWSNYINDIRMAFLQGQ